jgi:uncharacterized protein (TIGR03067 family)
MKYLVHTLLVAGSLLAAPPPGGCGAKGEKGLQGAWTIAKVEYDGAPQRPPKAALVLVRGAEVVYRFDGGWIFGEDASIKFTYKADPAKEPKAVDLISKDDKGKETILPGIYEVRGRRLKVCLGKDRPKEFTTRKGSERVLVVLRRR